MLYIVLLTTLLSESFYVVHKLCSLFHTVYHFSHSMYVHGVNDVRQTATHAAEPLVPETSALELNICGSVHHA